MDAEVPALPPSTARHRVSTMVSSPSSRTTGGKYATPATIVHNDWAAGDVAPGGVRPDPVACVDGYAVPGMRRRV